MVRFAPPSKPVTLAPATEQRQIKSELIQFIGTVARLMITALATAGTVMSVMGGFGFASLFNPLLPDQGAFTAVFLTLMGVLLIFATNTHHLMLMALVDSYTMFAPGAPPMFEDISDAVACLVTSSFKLGIQVASPFIVVGTIFYLGLGLLARLMPQFQVFFIGLPLQILLGLTLLSVTLSAGILWFLDALKTSMLTFFEPVWDMSEDVGESQKTEEPTQRKLEQARQRGNVQTSRELNTWVMLIGATIVFAVLMPTAMSDISIILRRFIESPHEVPFGQGGVGAAIAGMLGHIARALLVPMIILILAAIAGNVVQKGFLFAPKKLEPKLENISPKSGVKKIFSATNAGEFIKGLIKIIIVAVVGVLVLIPQFQRVDTLPMMELPQLLGVMDDLALQLLLVVVTILAVVAGIDVVFQRHQHFKKLRMTKVELKDEFKQAEGDPHIKSKLRQIRTERARLRMMAAVPEADVVVTNPTHFAIALQYKPDEMEAPKCVAKGQDLVALRIREIAEENNVAIVENPPLAHALFAAVEVDVEIPPEHYKAVAEVISYVWSLEGRLATA